MFSITPMSVGDEDKNGAELLQHVAAMLPLKIGQSALLSSLLLLKREEANFGRDAAGEV